MGVGKIAQDFATKNGYNTIQNLTGHQISRNKIHCGLSVPNYNNSDKRKIVDNMEIAIEPYFTLGAPRIKDKGDSNILQLVSTRNVRDPVAKKVLDYIKNYYPAPPFSKRWLVKDVIDEIYPNSSYSKEAFSMQEIRRVVKFLKMNKAIEEYSALLTVDRAINSQFEDTVVFVDGKKSVITRL
ncbi:MAG: hypothetical protein DRP06_02815 [Candidatus Aenigmatarchaeota archaeon]|nr:MAG: hypothetical protein DRP06_02815 [Candidatus Aenigmarchaeota archaeon]